VTAAVVTAAGIAGDRQKVRRIHGGPTRALCLWSAEVLQELRDEGHPLFGGACGENVLISGVDWSALQAGDRLGLGEVVAELTAPTAPCKQIRAYFAGGAIRRVDHNRYPPGTIAVGAAVTHEELPTQG
jgi:MOSC domain-containing protein YiiM